MSDITELEGRITAALDRIRKGIVDRPAAQPQLENDLQLEESIARVTDLEAQLDEERTANAQLEERVKTLKERQDTLISDLTSEAEEHRRSSAKALDESQKLRAVNAELRDINAALRDAVAQDAPDPHLINKGMLAEVEALRATRDADITEVDAVMSELKLLVTQEGEN